MKWRGTEVHRDTLDLSTHPFIRQLHRPAAEEDAAWADGRIRLRVRSYLSKTQPPREMITSARALVIRGTDVLVMSNRDRTHIMPGGRLEEDETPEEALRRELLEETGLEIVELDLLGFMHLRHLTVKPEDYAFPYPDFFWLIYAAEATTGTLPRPMTGDYEAESSFTSLINVRALELTPSEHCYLTSALSKRRFGGNGCRMNGAMIGLNRGVVEVVEHRPGWAALAADACQEVRRAGGELLADVQHVGSTAVPGLPAKPLLDLVGGMRNSEAIPKLVGRLIGIGYIYRGDGGDEGGHLLVRESSPDVRTIHLHVVEDGDRQWKNYLHFRDLLRRDSQIRTQYADLKKQLRSRYPTDREAYTAFKHDFIRRMLSGAPGHERDGE